MLAGLVIAHGHVREVNLVAHGGHVEVVQVVVTSCGGPISCAMAGVLGDVHGARRHGKMSKTSNVVIDTLRHMTCGTCMCPFRHSYCLCLIFIPAVHDDVSHPVLPIPLVDHWSHMLGACLESVDQAVLALPGRRDAEQQSV